MGALLKRTAELFLRHGGAAQLGRSRLRGRGLVLAYHNILPDGQSPGADRSLHSSQPGFAQQLDLLQEVSEVVPLSDLLFDSAPTTGTRSRVAITFDDAYTGALTAGVEELRRRSLPATVFVTPGFLGGRSFWWDEVLPVGGDSLPAEVREQLLTDCEGRDDLVRRWAAGQGYRTIPASAAARCASESLLAAALEYPGLCAGAHTWNHPNLTRIRGEALTDELVLPLQYLEGRFPRVLRVLAYPYGLTDSVVEAAAAAAGYRAALRVTGGWLPASPAAAPFRLPRLDVSSRLSLDGFALRLAGLFC